MVWSSPLALRVAPALAEDESPAAATLWGVWTSALCDRDDVDAPDGWSADAAAEVVRSVGASDYAARLDEASRRWEGLAPAARDVRARLVSWIVAPRRAETDEAAQLARLLETSRAENERLSTSVAEKDVLLAARERDLRSMRLKLQPTTPLDEALAAQVDRADRSETEAARHKTALDATRPRRTPFGRSATLFAPPRRRSVASARPSRTSRRPWPTPTTRWRTSTARSRAARACWTNRSRERYPACATNSKRRTTGWPWR